MMRVLDDFDFSNKRVIVRTDYNVPLDAGGRIVDDRRIRESIPTISYLLKRRPAVVILMSHLGRPDGRVVEKLRLDRVAKKLSLILKKKVVKLDDCVGGEVLKEIAGLPFGSVVLLENLRFHPEEEKNDRNFAKQLALLADVYVNDAFGCSHRAHASVVAIADFLPGCAGLLLEKELKMLSLVLKKPKRPFVVVLGGAKVSDKIGFIKNLVKRADRVLVGGAMVYTFYKALGFGTGKSLVENDKVGFARELLRAGRKKLVLPSEVVVADSISAKARTRIVGARDIPEGWVGLDVSPKAVDEFKLVLKRAGTVLWNGPLGFAEIPKFARGTNAVARFIANLDCTTVVCGGDTGAVVERLGLARRFSHVSTGGGAALEFLEGKKLPALRALEKNAEKFR